MGIVDSNTPDGATGPVVIHNAYQDRKPARYPACYKGVILTSISFISCTELDDKQDENEEALGTTWHNDELPEEEKGINQIEAFQAFLMIFACPQRMVVKGYQSQNFQAVSVSVKSFGVLGSPSTVSGVSYVEATVMASPLTSEAVLTIKKITSPSSSQLSVSWNLYSTSCSYLLDLRVVNNSKILPIVTDLSAGTTSRLIQALRPGVTYNITLKAVSGTVVLASTWKDAITVPSTPQILRAASTSSSEMNVEWSEAVGADRYYLVIKSSTESYNLSYSSLSAYVSSLQPVTQYKITLYGSNTAGLSAASKTRIITTLIQPPTDVIATTISASTVQLQWNDVPLVTFYGILTYKTNVDLIVPVDFKKTYTASILLNNLQPYTNYTFGLTSYNDLLVPGEEYDFNYTTNSMEPVQYIQAQYYCAEQIAIVIWEATPGAVSYTVIAQAVDGHQKSCKSLTASCKIFGLSCGLTYSVKVIAESTSCTSISTADVTFDTAPCPPLNVAASHDCDNIQITWDQHAQATSYIATATGSDGTVSQCSTAETSCFFPTFGCGQDVTMSVRVSDGKCNSSSSDVVHINTVPCQPQNVIATVDCVDNFLTVSWQTAEGALSYEATATGSNGNVYVCSSFAGICIIEGLLCGDSLSVSVIAFDDQCSSSESNPEIADTVPCAPEYINVNANCSDSTALVTHDFSNGTIFYVSYAEGEDGTEYVCESYETSCLLTELACGQSYSLYTISSNVKCNSSRSATVGFQTAPCTPYNIDGALDCDTNSIIAMWAQNSGSLSYNAVVEDSDGVVLYCNSTQDNCIIPDTKCGTEYSLYVTADNGICQSPRDLPVILVSEPCIPPNAAIQLDCVNRNIQIFWSHSTGGEMYTAYVEAGDRSGSFCNSTGTTCSIDDLQCGEPYGVTVTASNSICSSDRSEDIFLQPVPCVPEAVTTHFECGYNNAVNVSWNHTVAAKYYSVTAVSADEHTVVYNTTDTNCTIDALQCGALYTVSVTASNGNCLSQMSLTSEIQTAPCVPDYLQAQLDCGSDTAMLSWSGSVGAKYYTAEAVGEDGHIATCNTSDTRCEIGGLHCGQVYTVTMTASDEKCSSLQSATSQVTTTPCVPDYLQAELDCGSNIAMLSWSGSAGDKYYTAEAVGEDGHIATCNTADTRCEIGGLHCGQMYTISMTASDEKCSSLQNAISQINTAPCVPQNVISKVNCPTGIVVVSWKSSPGAMYYITNALGSRGHSTLCNTTDTTCSLRDLLCGQTYSFTVTAYDENCNSSQSIAAVSESVPCVASNVVAVLDCGTNGVTVSWNGAEGALSYAAVLTGKYDETRCETIHNTCSINGLHCSQTYAVSVSVLGGSCESSTGAISLIQTVPCIPSITSADLNCSTQSVFVAWSNVTGAESYTAAVEIDGTQTASCHTNNTACEITQIACGKTYEVSVTATKATCSSNPSTSLTVQTEPCPPKNVMALLQYTNDISVSWGPSPGAISYILTIAGSDGVVTSYNATTNAYDITSLPCGTTYSIIVTALGDGCNSAQSSSISAETVPCVPDGITVIPFYENNTVLISWNKTYGATSYLVVGEGSEGDILSCSSVDTFCYLIDLQCGEEYNITLMAILDKTNGSQSPAITIKSAPCQPSQVRSEFICDTDITTVNWTISAGAVSYRVNAIGSKGHTALCTTSDTFCDFPDLMCGENYYITVTALNLQTSSIPSSTSEITTGPCMPENIAVFVNCPYDIISVSWDKSDGAAYYTVTVENGDGYVYCNTTDTGCDISILNCGQMYRLAVTAQDGGCRSSEGFSSSFSTAPCAPQYLDAQVSCESGDVTIHWEDTDGAKFYKAIVEGGGGQIESCNSSSTFCDFSNLVCGDEFSATVVAFDERCNSSFNTYIAFNTVPCVPDNIEAYLNCDSQTISVAWNSSSGAMYYTASAITSSGHSTYCNTTNAFCDISGLICGETYNVTLTASDSSCTSAESISSSVQSAPCVPRLADVFMDCDSNIMLATWNKAAGAGSYIATAEDGDGRLHLCIVNDTSCEISDLVCGTHYQVTVLGVSEDESCNSTLSDSITTETAPCIPQNIHHHLDCQTNDVTVSWNSSDGALQYMVVAQGNDGHSVTVNTTQTTCDFAALHCGQSYTVQVTAGGTNCTSQAEHMFITAPCAPEGLQPHVDCATNIMLATWVQSKGAESYVTTVYGSDGQKEQCNTTDTECEFTTLHCGDTFDMVVMAVNEQCSSNDSTTVQFKSAPCTPEGLQPQVDCATNIMLATWNHSNGAVSYVTTVYGSGGQTEQCNTTDTECEFTDLQCGDTFEMVVTAVSEQCNSNYSTPVQFKSVPCAPANLVAEVDCNTGATNCSWNSSNGGKWYTITAEGSDGSVAECNTTELSCEIINLNCGQNYTMSIVAADEVCESSLHLITDIKSVPCKPDNIQATPDQNNPYAALATWSPSEGALSYTATLEGMNGHRISCNSTDTECSVSNLHCGQTYSVNVLAHNEKCSCYSNTTENITTAPCAPQHISAVMNYDNSSVTVSWDVANGSLVYISIAQGSDGDLKICETMDLLCIFQNLHCGENYTITVIATGEGGNSTKNPTVTVTTAPCPLQEISAVMNYDDSSVTVSWVAEDPSLVYKVIAQGTDGDIVTCETTASSCILPNLQCGVNYTITVIATEEGLNSTGNPTVTVTTAPCPLQQISAVMNYDDSSATVSWVAEDASLVYKVIAQGTDGDIKTCETTTSSCILQNLHCGDNYTITATATEEGLNSTGNPTVTVTTAPCPLQEISAVMNYDNSSATVSWVAEDASLVYKVIAQGTDGDIKTCETTASSCILQNLHCGDNYTITVIATEEGLNSTGNPTVTVTTAPCPLQEISAIMNYDNSSVTVSWVAEDASLVYKVIAQGTDGDIKTCETMDSSCILQNLHCGDNYTITVIATGEGLNSTGNPTVTVTTAPCPLQEISAVMNYDGSSATVSWVAEDASLVYKVIAQGTDGDIKTCETMDSSCILQNLHCGDNYTITVIATDKVLNSTGNPTVTVTTAPCPLQQISAVMNYDDSSATVSWVAEDALLEYKVTAQGTDGDIKTCETMASSCILQNLNCGDNYTITVIATGEGLNSTGNPTVTVTTAPCPLQQISAVMNYDNSSATVSWEAEDPSLVYKVTAQGTDGDIKTCETMASSCILQNLHCGDNYTITVIATEEGLNSTENPTVTVTTAPCPLQQISAVMNYDNSSATVSWVAEEASLVYKVTAQGTDGDIKTCETMASSCILQNLHCGDNYTITVIATEEGLNSTGNPTVTVTTEPCTPSNIGAYLVCETNTANVSWNLSAGAQYYITTATGSDGSQVSCKTDSLSCDLVGLHCGMKYNISVKALDNKSQSKPTSVVNIQTVPCIPQNVRILENCPNNSTVIAWELSRGAQNYRAVAEDTEGNLLVCTSAISTCEIQDLLCGTAYIIHVTASDSSCTSPPASSYTTRTAPCPPQNTIMSVDCATQIASFSWDQVGGAVSYSVIATGDDGGIYSCNTTDTFCHITTLKCGQKYTVDVLAIDDLQCNSVPESSSEIQSVPCVPQIISADVNCETNYATVVWNYSDGALSYEATATGLNGHKAKCISSNETCDITELECGLEYQVTVTAVSNECQSVSSSAMDIITVPCVPENLQATIDCQSNVATVSWNESQGADFYSVMAMGADGHIIFCSATNTSCKMTDLRCGQPYNMTVTATGLPCNSSQSMVTDIQAVPCSPHYILAETDCDTGTVAISWEQSEGALFYAAFAEDSEGNSVSCNTSSTTCDINSLQCGQSYTVSVIASDNICSSAENETFTVSTAPCSPPNARATLGCASNVISIYWGQSNGAQLYIASAVSEDGDSYSCNTTDTSCDFVDVQCGEKYLITLMANDSKCNSHIQTVATLQTAPCIPENGYAELDCSTNIIAVSWNQSKGAVNYIATAVAPNGLNYSCETTSTACTIEDAECGQTYVIDVTATDSNCSSSPHTVTTLHAVPCAPINAQTQPGCFSNFTLVSWGRSEGALEYIATAEDPDGQVYTCISSSGFCQIEDLNCGMEYAVHVIASNNICNSSQSTSSKIKTAPCPAKNISTHVDCTTEIALFSWDPSEGAISYTASASGRDGSSYTCNTTDTSCSIPTLACGQKYTVDIVATDEMNCSSMSEAPMEIQSVPCVPDIIRTDVDCDTNILAIFWDNAKGAESYTAKALNSTEEATSCKTENTTCELDGLLCGASYFVTVTAHDTQCSSLESSHLAVDTVPCVPDGLQASVICDSNDGDVSWQPSQGAESYSVTAVDSDGHIVFCDSGNTSCQLSELNCGKQYNVTVAAIANLCNSSQSLPINILSVPCSAYHTATSKICETGLVSVSWEHGEGTDLYTAIAEGTSGFSATCETQETSCDLSDLLCGHTYTITVKGTNYNCSSYSSDSATVNTVPCRPQNVKSTLTCATNIGLVTWEPADGAQSYKVVAEGSNGEEESCSTTDTNCTLTKLSCGQYYRITVIALDDACATATSISNIKAAPCAPVNVNGELSCTTNTVTVSWDQSENAISYTATAVGIDGHTASCNSETTTCDISSLHCGQSYSVTVTAYDNKCGSDSSAAFTFVTVPCVPSNTQVQVDCATNSAVFSWDASKGGTSYFAVTEEGHNSVSFCSTKQTKCATENLVCGTTYTFSVSASDGVCNSSYSLPITGGAVPCPPDVPGIYLRRMFYGTQEAEISWIESHCGSEYSANVIGQMENDPDSQFNLTSYWTDYPFFLIPIPCSSTFNISITAKNAAGVSVYGPPFGGMTAPCPPQRITVANNSNSLQISWQTSTFATTYKVYNVFNNQSTVICTTSDSTCSVPTSVSGYIEVTALNSAGESEPGLQAAQRRKKRSAKK
ncbi:uncharacterized protein LOC122814297 [Protopterus annectens]|uniref:uncharacterized protein LOC122814297 n=1 Tax=Protopterus annectens TaxID=7888 RepID=UPI001CF977E0|nr:uncharacterized protein LOC122814297 [Protopterus annectens]